ncbi:MAG TPA: GspH/FimT family pseudopilin [Gemmatimonadaceae bacterium]|nr:GspH/FimT family pseudopilin [Gemmatimonadaceae bacterium]
MRSSRRGFTLAELLIVIVIMGVVSVIALPKATDMMTSLGVRSATQSVAAYLARTRAAAIQTGRTATFVRSGNVVWVRVTRSGGAVDTIGRPRDLAAEHSVTLSGPDTIAYNPRGFAVALPATTAIVVTRDSERDSVCIFGLGKISTTQCGF